MKDRVNEFKAERNRLQNLMQEHSGLSTKRFLSLDSQVYREGVIETKIKEMMGLVASLVLRCDDCIRYHLDRCYQEGVNEAELEEVLSIGLVVGGSITIPHIRRAWDFWENMISNPENAEHTEK
ncbi:MAG: carboxymuconolactone decarboxylase family protein [Candidatus Stygibacter australis]|nr:carboxymuconolactone decarboxylase family protein [Candidatus Stygibacter australis]MDP8323453.1 carboxymuconolactone decarboxylase family protein [Candidatus Stygibacter australis]